MPSKNSELIVLRVFSPPGARAAEREMFADMLGIRLNWLVRYIPVNQVGLSD